MPEVVTVPISSRVPGRPERRVQVTWWVEERPAGRGLRWDWTEHDEPPVGYPTREGFDSRLLNKVVAAQTGAEVDVAFAWDGLRVSVRVPLPMDGIIDVA